MTGNINIVIGSWGSYNECNERALGSKWLDLSDYYDWDEIVEELKKEGFELDGIDEELFIQDVEGIDDGSVNWDYVNPETLFNTLNESGVLTNDYKYKVFCAFLEVRNFDDFEERVRNKGDGWDDDINLWSGFDWEDYGKEMLDCCGYNIPDEIYDFNMAYYKITTDKKGKLVAKMQAYGKDLETGERKLYTKRFYNEDGLTEAKFKKYLDKEAIAFEEELERAYREHDVSVKTRVLTFPELMAEWKENIKTNLSISYYERASEVEKKFNEYLKEVRLYDKPISAITVRDVQLFLNSFASKKYNLTLKLTAKLKNPLPKVVNFRQLAREGIIDRSRSYYMNHRDTHIEKETARAICERYNLNYDDYFETVKNERSYAVETIKGYRRVLRTLFNEAVRYEWIAKNPVCGTKIGAGSSNTSLRAVPEKEVFSFKEAQEFLSMLDGLPDDIINQRVCIKLMLLTGIRNAELHGLRWSDVDLENHILHVRRNRLVSQQFGVYEKSPKTKTSLRDIPMPDNLVEDLKWYKDWFRLADDKFDERQDEYYLAVGLDRQPLYPHTMGHWLTKLEAKHGFKHVSCHGLRHTYCSLLLSQNVPIQTVSKYMGHSDSTVTLEVYSHFIPDTQEKAVFALNNLTK